MGKIAVIGGSGFLGSHIADELSARNHDVLVIDRQPSRWLSGSQQMIICDCCDSTSLQRNIEGCDSVYHCAGVADIDEAAASPMDTVKTNIIGTATVLEACIAKRIKRFFFASSLYVYSDEGSFYRLSKKACEELIETYAKTYNLKYSILRYGSLYGERAQSWNPVYRLVNQVLHSDVINFSGTGNERREYIHVSDAARLSVDIMGSEFENKSIIISGNQVVSSLDLINMVREITGRFISVNFAQNDPNNRYSFTPYKFSPRPAKRLALKSYTDLGQGLLSLVENSYQEALNHNEGLELYQ